MGVPFIPTLGFAGTDVLQRRQDAFKIAPHPWEPDELVVMAKAITPDVGIFHGLKADRRGNVLVRKGGEELMLAQASSKVIVTVEEMVDQVDPEASSGCFIPSLHVTAVVHAPFGAYPTGAPDYYEADAEQIKQYVEASASDDAFAVYLNRYVFEPASHEAYVALLGLDRVQEAVAL
jgi:glutaconate CoA-transferase subunit A